MTNRNSQTSKLKGGIAIGFAVGIVAGAVLGLGFGGGRFSREGSTAPGLPDDSTPITLTGVKGTSDDALGALLDAGGGEVPLDRSRKVLAFVDGVPHGEIGDRLDEVFSRRHGNRERDLIERLYEKWVDLDSEGAIRHSRGLEGSDRMFAVDTVLSAWASKAPYDALAWMERHGKGINLDRAVDAALRAIARTNPEEAIDLVEKNKALKSAGAPRNPDGSEGGMVWTRNIGTRFLFGIWAERDPQAAAARALAIPNSDERVYVLQTLAIMWAYRNPTAAWEWGSAVENGRDRAAVLQSVIGAVVEDGDTNRAISFFEAMPPGRERLNALQQIIHDLSFSDPERAYDFARRQAGARGDAQAYSHIFQQWVRNDPARAFEVAVEELDPGQTRTSVIESIVNEVANRDLALALEMVKKIDTPTMGNAASSVASVLARNDVAEALAWVDELPEGEAKGNALSVVVSVWTAEDPEAACGYSLGLENEEARSTILRRGLERWGHENPVAAMAWAVENLAAEGQENLIPGAIISTWADQDIAGASEWVAALPEGNLRARSAVSLVSSWALYDLVAAGEWIKTLKPGESRDSAVHVYASEVFETDPEASLIWAESIGDNEGRQEKMEGLAQRYLRSNPANAKRWIANSSLPQERKEELLKSAEGN